jgi:hypothetical protein
MKIHVKFRGGFNHHFLRDLLSARKNDSYTKQSPSKFDRKHETTTFAGTQPHINDTKPYTFE